MDRNSNKNKPVFWSELGKNSFFSTASYLFVCFYSKKRAQNILLFLWATHCRCVARKTLTSIFNSIHFGVCFFFFVNRVKQVLTNKTSQIVYRQILTLWLTQQALGANLTALAERRSHASGPELSPAPQSALVH